MTFFPSHVYHGDHPLQVKSSRLFLGSCIGGTCGMEHVLYETKLKFWLENVPRSTGKECYGITNNQKILFFSNLGSSGSCDHFHSKLATCTKNGTKSSMYILFHPLLVYLVALPQPQQYHAQIHFFD